MHRSDNALPGRWGASALKPIWQRTASRPQPNRRMQGSHDWLRKPCGISKRSDLRR